MEISQRGLDFIAEFEGFSATAYLDENDGWTIGYGHLIQPNEAHLRTAPLTKEQALDLLRQDAGRAQASVRGMVQKQLNQNEFDALTSLVFNIGSGQFSSSTVLRVINEGADKATVSEAWKRWKWDDGQVLPGLVRRRQAEVDMYYQDDLKKKSESPLLSEGSPLLSCPSCGTDLRAKIELQEPRKTGTNEA